MASGITPAQFYSRDSLFPYGLASVQLFDAKFPHNEVGYKVALVRDEFLNRGDQGHCKMN